MFFFVDNWIEGKSDAVEGHVVLGEDGYGDIRVGAGSFESGNGKRDSHVREILKAGSYPHVVFHLVSVQGIGMDGAGEGEATGTLTLHGVSQPVRFPVRWVYGEGTLTLQGETVIRFDAFGLKPPTLGGGVIKEADENLTVGATIILAPY